MLQNIASDLLDFAVFMINVGAILAILTCFIDMTQVVLLADMLAKLTAAFLFIVMLALAVDLLPLELLLDFFQGNTL